MNDYRINVNYAKALLMLANDLGCAQEVRQDMELVGEVCAENREFAVVFSNPAIRQDKKAAILHDLFASHVHKATMAFLDFVVRKRRAVNLKGIAGSYVEQFCEANNIVRADMVTRLPITDEAVDRMAKMVEDYTHKQVELNHTTDHHMLGSFKLMFDNKMYDARIRTKIARLCAEFAKNDYESKL